jgi:hypothetical protein
MKLWAPSMITSPDGNGVILIGGNDGSNYLSSLYRLNCIQSGCYWQEMEQKLKVARDYFVSMMIPDSLTNCTKTIV